VEVAATEEMITTEKSDNKPAAIVTAISSSDAGMINNSIAGQWWLSHRSTPLQQMRIGNNMKIEKQQSTTQKTVSENNSAVPATVKAQLATGEEVQQKLDDQQAAVLAALQTAQ